MNIGFESEIIEYKKSTSEIKEGVISISSILNKHGRGTLYFGVLDSGEVVGQQIGKETLRDISRAIAEFISPDFRYEISSKKTADDKSFIEVVFSGSDAPYSAYGKYYQRFADEDKAITDSALEKLFISRRKDYSAWENDISESTVADVDEKFIKRLVADGIGLHHFKYSYTTKTAALKKLGLLAADNKHLNNAGRVLFSKRKPVLLKMATFAGSTKEKFLRLEHFEGNIFECIDAGIDYIASGISYDINITGKSDRDEHPEIPLNAVREIVVNAFAHSDYSANSVPEIEIYKDKVVIYSPGHFPRGYTPEDFANRSEKPIMLNPKILETLFRTGRIESFGYGFEKVFSECEKTGVSYSYRDTKSGFEFTFERPLNQKVTYKLSKSEDMVLREICEHPFYTAKTIADNIGKSEKTVSRAIKKLKDNDRIERSGSDYNGYWIVKNGF